MQTPTPLSAEIDSTPAIPITERPRISNLPPTTESRKLAKLILESVTKIADDNKISLSDICNILEDVDIERIAEYRHPILQAIATILQQRDDLFNVWSEAMTMVQLEISHRVIAQNDKTIAGKLLNLLNIR